MTSIELRLDDQTARQTADDIEAVLDALALGVVDCCTGELERILVDVLEALEAIVRRERPDAADESGGAAQQPA